jgi:hypothetical protein
MSQMPPQQSTELVHTSPVWMHQPGVSPQVPLLQYFEQHSPLAPQALPAVLHEVLIGAQEPFVQVPLQHAPFVVQACESETQLAPQTPELQLSEQQSVPDAHAAPDAKHLPTVEPHAPVAASHEPEQHCAALWQVVPVALQVVPTLASGLPDKSPVELPQFTTNSVTAISQAQRAIIRYLPS